MKRGKASRNEFVAELTIRDNGTGAERHFFLYERSAKKLKHLLYKLSFLDLFGEEHAGLRAWLIENEIETTGHPALTAGAARAG